MLETIKISDEEATIRRLMDSVFMKVAEVEHLKRENEKLSVDSVALDEIISVVYGWNRDARGYPDMAMKKIVKIIDEHFG
jgi:hypothetical protein